MRQSISLAAGILLLASLANPVFSQDTKQKNKKDDRPKIEGSGHVISRDVTIQSFDQLEASGVFNVTLTQSGQETVKIEADDNLQDLFEVRNDGTKLIIKMKKDQRFNTKAKLNVYITFKKLKSMDLALVGNLSSEGNLNFDDFSLDNKNVGAVDLALTVQKLQITNSSVGNLKLKGTAENAIIRSSSVGAIRAGDLVVQTMDIDNNGIGGAEVNAAKELRVTDSFLGKVKNVGSANPKMVKKVVI